MYGNGRGIRGIGQGKLRLKRYDRGVGKREGDEKVADDAGHGADALWNYRAAFRQLLVAVLQAYRSWSSIWSGEYFGIRVLCGIAADA